MGATAPTLAESRNSADPHVRLEKLPDLEREFQTCGQARKAIYRGELTGYRLGSRWIRVRREDFLHWLESKRIPADRTGDNPSIEIGGGA